MEQDPLSQLKDIHIPSPGGFWPPAPGWWILLFSLTAVIVMVGLVIRRRRQRNAWYHQARRELDRLANRAAANGAWFSELNTLLKRSAIARYPQRQPESLTGPDWVNFLLETSPRDRVASRPVVTAMVESCYQTSPGCSTTDAAEFAKLWLEGQKC